MKTALLDFLDSANSVQIYFGRQERKFSPYRPVVLISLLLSA